MSDSLVLGRVFIIFWSLCLTRMAIDEYANRFYSHDLFHKTLYLIYTAGVFVQVMNVSAYPINSSNTTPATYGVILTSDSTTLGLINGMSSDSASTSISNSCYYPTSNSIGILAGLLLTRVALILVHGAVMYNNKQATEQFIFDIIRWSISSFVVVAGIIVNLITNISDEANIAFQFIVIIVETVAWFLSRSLFRHKYTYPIDLELLQSRWGVWVMIVIGEAIIQLLIPILPSNGQTKFYEINLLALLLMFSIAMQYYDSCHRQWYEHAITKSALAGLVWIWLHPAMTFSLFGVGIAIHISTGVNDRLTANSILPASCCGVTLCLTMMRLAHEGFQPKYYWIYVFKFIAAILQFIILFFNLNNFSLILLIESIISVLMNLIDIIYMISFTVEIDKNAASARAKPFHRLPLAMKRIGLASPVSMLFQSKFLTPKQKPKQNSQSKSNSSLNMSGNLNSKHIHNKSIYRIVQQSNHEHDQIQFEQQQLADLEDPNNVILQPLRLNNNNRNLQYANSYKKPEITSEMTKEFSLLLKSDKFPSNMDLNLLSTSYSSDKYTTRSGKFTVRRNSRIEVVPFEEDEYYLNTDNNNHINNHTNNHMNRNNSNSIQNNTINNHKNAITVSTNNNYNNFNSPCQLVDENVSFLNDEKSISLHK